VGVGLAAGAAREAAHRPKVHCQQHDADHKVGHKLVLVDDLAEYVEHQRYHLARSLCALTRGLWAR